MEFKKLDDGTIYSDEAPEYGILPPAHPKGVFTIYHKGVLVCGRKTVELAQARVEELVTCAASDHGKLNAAKLKWLGEKKAKLQELAEKLKADTTAGRGGDVPNADVTVTEKEQ